jgi:hypothetical protein
MPSAHVTEQDLRERLAAAEQDLVDAQRDVGAAELDGGDVAAAAERVADARAAIERVNSAIAEFDDRAEKREELERLRADAERRRRVLVWCRDYVRLAAPVIDLRARLADAEKELMGLGSVAQAAGLTRSQMWVYPLPVSGLPEQAIEQIHMPPDVRRGQVGNLTVEACERLGARLDVLLEEAAAVTDADLLAAERERRAA